METEFIGRRSLFLSIDQGGHASRALVYTREGAMVAEGVERTRLAHPHPDWVEQDPEELVAATRKAIEIAWDRLGERQADVAYAGFATQRSSIACWDRETGEALAPIISWQDRRAAGWLGQFAQLEARIHKTTGLVLSPHYGASKLRWCIDNLAPVKQALQDGRLAFGPMASFLLFRLLPERPLLVDPANASRTLLWSLKTLDWDPELLALFGLPRDPLPRCVPTRYDYGHLALGGRRVPVRVVNGDQSAAMYAYGRLLPDAAYINTGTGAFVSRPSGHYPGYSRRLLTGIVLLDGDEATYVLEGTVNGAGSALSWLRDEYALPSLYEDLPAWLARTEAPPLFLNGISGLGAPFWVADFESQFVGEGETWQRAVAVVESIVFLLQANLEEMSNLASPPQHIQISGGLAVLDGLCQRLTDLTGLPVYRPQEREATARGTAYLLADCPDYWPETELGGWFKPAPNPGLRERYERWRRTMLAHMRR